MRGQALKGHLDLLILAVLSGEPLHGYAVVEELARRSGGALDVAEGTVYPALYRLERAGLLRSRWATESGRRRRLYTLSARGRTTLERRRKEWRSFAAAVEAVVT
jgi:PadR family transcriptional regulator, regulatory protein PadR